MHTLPGRDGSTGLLVVGIAATTPPTVVHRAATGVATVLLSLLTSPRHALATDTGGAGALVRLMLGASPSDGAPASCRPTRRPADAGSSSTAGAPGPRPARQPRPTATPPSSRPSAPRWAPPTSTWTVTHCAP
ncbi:hypothetical protein [Streptomyces sp. NPDC054854]